jgi:hypothetical protein
MPTLVGASALGSVTAGTIFDVSGVSGKQDGDLMLIFVESANQSVATPTVFDANDTLTDVDVWSNTIVAVGTGTAGSSTATRLSVFHRFFVSGVDDFYSNRILFSGDHMTYGFIVLRGVDQATPIDAYVTGTAASSTSVTITGTNTTVGNCYVLAVVANSTDTATSQGSGHANASLSGITEVLDQNGTSGNGGGYTVIGGGLVSAGSTGNTTLTLGTASVQAFATIAIRGV